MASIKHLEKNIYRKREDHLKSEPCKKRELELEWGRGAPLRCFHLADPSSIHHTPKTVLQRLATSLLYFSVLSYTFTTSSTSVALCLTVAMLV